MQAKKVDINQPQIFADCEKLGISCQSLHELGKGCPDAVFGYAGINLFVEIKNGKNDLNDLQIDYHQKWNGQVGTIWNTFDLVKMFIRYSYGLSDKITVDQLELMMNYMVLINGKENVS